MVRKIYLLRHGEAEHPHHGSKDFERSLTSSGVAQIRELGRLLDPEKFNPGVVYCSPSLRTNMTYQNFSEVMRAEWDVEFRDEIYEASVRTLFELISDTDNSIFEVLLIGHNPGISYLAEYLSGDSIMGMYPGQLIKLDFALGDWGDLSQGTCSIIQ